MHMFFPALYFGETFLVGQIREFLEKTKVLSKRSAARNHSPDRAKFQKSVRVAGGGKPKTTLCSAPLFTFPKWI